MDSIWPDLRAAAWRAFCLMADYLRSLHLNQQGENAEEPILKLLSTTWIVENYGRLGFIP